jgi:hypothetical protein
MRHSRGRPLAERRDRAKDYTMGRTSLTLIVGLLSGAGAAAPAQGPADTTLTAEGFLQNDEQFDLWTMVLPLPLHALGTSTFVLPLVGGAGRWSPLRNRYVAAHGRVSRMASGGTPGIGFTVDDMREREPPGTVRVSVDRGATRHSEITLSVIPNRFGWHDAQGNESGVNPMLLYTITNRRETPIFFMLPSNDFLCVSVRSLADEAGWDSTTHVQNPDGRRFAVQRGGLFREAIQLPHDVATRPGHYRAHIGICAFDDFDVTAEFEVQ